MLTRRSFFRGLLLASGAGLLWPAARAWAKKLAIRLDQAPMLKKPGGWVILKILDHDVLFIRVDEQTLKAFSAVCTHQKCLVAYAPADRQIECPCHHSHFSLTGEVLSGPAPRPLPEYPARIDGQRIILTLD